MDTTLKAIETSLLHSIGMLGVGQEAYTEYGETRFTSIIEAFDEAVEDFTITPRLLGDVKAYLHDIRNRNDDHRAFFGGNLLGTQRLLFLDVDRERWFDEVLRIDEDYLRECVHAVPYFRKAVKENWQVATDVFNHSCLWLVHKILTAPNGRDPKYQECAVNALIILQFRFMSSLYNSPRFSRLVDEELAQATYASLTLKFSLKQLGSWEAWMRDRAETFIAKDGLHYRRFLTFSPDDAVVYILSDLQTRVRTGVNDIYSQMERVRLSGGRMIFTSAKIELDGEQILKDNVSMFQQSKDYLFDVAGNKNSFIKRELVGVVLDMMKTVSEQAFVSLLETISTSSGRERQEVEWMMENTLLHAFTYIATERIRFNDVTNLLIKMYGLYTSNKTTNPIILELRTRIEKFAKKNSHLRSTPALAAARTSIMLYFLLRALAANQYR